MSAVLDLGPLSWVKSEIDSSLERARVALRAYGGDAERTSELKACKNHLHQASGAVQIVGLEGVTRFFAETEALLAELEAGTVQATESVRGAIERAIAAIGKYLSELLDGAPDQPLRLFAGYRDVVQARGAPAAVEADLYFPDVSLGPAARPGPARDLARTEALAHLRAQRARFQRGFVRWLRTPADVAALEEMRAAADAIEETQASQVQRAFWWAAAALIDALVHGDLEPEPGVKHLCSRIEQQMRRMIEGSESVAERLLREALYWVARAGLPRGPEGSGNLRDAVLRARGDAKSVRALAVKQAFRLEGSLPPRESPADLSQRVPMALALRDTLDEAKEAWNRFAAGAESALAAFARAVAGIVALAPALRQGPLSELAAEVARAAAVLQAEPKRMSEALAMEVATALLMAENAAENYAELAPDFAPQARAMCARLGAALAGTPAPETAAGGPLIDVLTRRAQEKLAVASAVAEMQGNLHKIEQALDGYFRDPAKAGELAALEPMIHQVAGALELLGEEEARGALERCAARIRAFARALTRPALEEFEELAQVLSGLGFYIDALRHGKADFAAAMQPVRVRPALPAAVARVASVETELERQKEEIQSLYETWRARPGDGKLRAELKARLKSVRKDADLVANQALASWSREVLARLKRAPRADDAEKIALTMAHLGPQTETPSAEAQRLKDASVERIDAELLAIFLEEAVSVLVTIADNLAVSRTQPASMAHLITVRRSFHTLKGSGRMVGLARLAEAAWAVEQVMNLWLQQERTATPELLALIELAHSTFSAWVERLQHGESQPDATALLAAAERVRRGGPALAAAPVPAPEADIEIGEARISPSLFAVFVNEARQHLDTLERNLAAAAAGAPREEHTRAAHTLAGICGTVQIPAMQELGHALEVALARLRNRPAAPGGGELELVSRSIAALREMYAGVLERRAAAPRPDLTRALEAVAAETRPIAVPAEVVRPAPPRVAPAAAAAPIAGRVAEEIPLDRRERRIEDEVDAQLIPVFLEEAAELVPKVGELLRAWRAEQSNFEHASELQRLLHTFKGSARMAGIMSLGELTHNMEARVETAAALKLTPAQLFDDLESSYDRIGFLIERLQRHAALEPERAPAEAPAPRRERAAPRTMLRVRTELVEKLVNQAGEVSITRARIEGEMRALKGSLAELTANVARLRRELREIEIQAESQMQARVREAEEAERPFDPLEIDRFTRFQEISRFMAESVNDLSTVHQNITRSVDDTDSALLVQSRLTRELQQELMRIRMVPIGSLAERLHRLARQTAKELGKRVNLDIHGAQVELDRSVLERMAAPLEHMVRNAVIHGIEPPAARAAAGKPEMGEIQLDVRQEGNEVTIAFFDDGAGLDLERIRARALAQGLLHAGDPISEQSLAELVFVPGFSTAEVVTEIAGRGVGMDVVKNEVSGLGGRVELASTPARGTRFTIRLPLTTAVTQTVLVKSGSRICALPAVMVEQVQHLRGAELARVRAAGEYEWSGRRYPLAYLPELLGEPGNPEAAKRFLPVILLRSGADSVALLVDEMLGNQENVVKNLGPQLARVPGVAGVTVLGSGEIVLILNPVPLARLGPRPQSASVAPLVAAAQARPKVMVVDDSLTVRKITGRLLAREGYEVLTAKDGVEALEQLAETTPDVMLVDIEMPRMDGFDLTRNVRADARLKRVPIIMITSRTAAKHRAYAAELGVDVFLGKPYREEELLGHIASYLGS